MKPKKENHVRDIDIQPETKLIGKGPKNYWIIIQVKDIQKSGKTKITGEIKILRISDSPKDYKQQHEIFNDFFNMHSNNYFDIQDLENELENKANSTSYFHRNSWGLYNEDLSEYEIIHIDSGAGLGHSESNKEVEEAAINTVIDLLEREGWDVDPSYQQKKCGYDLHCTKEESIKCVEVKGVKGSLESFFITHGEAKQARNNPNFELIVVTNALTNPDKHRYSGQDFLDMFESTPVMYSAKKK